MIFQLLKQLKTDVWFCFDGFSYGCECVIAECAKDSMNLILKPEPTKLYSTQDNIFFEQLPFLLKSSFPRLHTELRVYFPNKFAKELNASRKIVLISERNPELIKHQLNGFQMRFISLRGRTKKHVDNWKRVTSYEFRSGFDNF